MLKKNEVDNPKKKKKKRVIDHAKVAENKKRAKANKAKLKKKLREDKACPKEETTKKSGKMKKNREPLSWKKLVIILAACVAGAAVIGTGSGFAIHHYVIQKNIENAVVEAMVHTDAVELAEYSKTQHRKDHVKQNAGKDTTQALVDAARYMIDGIKNRPPEVEVTAENAENFATIESCLINT